MLNKNIALIVLIIVILFSSRAYSQEDDLGTEVVNIVKPYSPTLSDAFKVKESPILNDSVSNIKKKVQYSIFSVPVASTFTPAKGKAVSVEKVKPVKLYDNYASFGLGNYGTVLGELYSNFQISRTDDFGLFFKHNSTQGGIDNIRLNDKYFETRLDGNYTSRQKDMSYIVNAGIEHQAINWYGLPSIFDNASIEIIDAIDPQQTYFSAFVGGSISPVDSFYESADLNIRYLGDAFSSSEINITSHPEFVVPLTKYTLKIDTDIDYLSGSFDRSYLSSMGRNYSFLLAGIAPSLVYVNNDFTISLGAATYIGVDLENSNSEFYIYPRLNVSYRLVDELLIAYGGADGGLHQNTYYGFKSENIFVSPTLKIAPTSELYDAFLGLKGKLSNSIGYNVRTSYNKVDDKTFFLSNLAPQTVPSTEGYEFGNSFTVIYDTVNTLEIFGELTVEVSDVFSLGINGRYYSYNMTHQLEPWNAPDLEASIFSTFNLSDKIYGGLSIFYVGERTDLKYGGVINPEEIPPIVLVSLDGYVDANLHFGYRVNEQLSIFLKGSNLLNDNYEKWLNYPVQGIQGLIGGTYKFDW